MIDEILEQLAESGADMRLIVKLVYACFHSQPVEVPSAGALRMRRYRERHQASQVTPVTSHDVTSDAKEAPSPHPNPKKNIYINARTREAFEIFWYAYPRRIAKGAALKAYRKALERSTEAEILAGANRFSAASRGKEPEFIPHPASWLNADRWLDEPDKKPGNAGVLGPQRTWAEIKAEREKNAGTVDDKQAAH